MYNVPTRDLYIFDKFAKNSDFLFLHEKIYSWGGGGWEKELKKKCSTFVKERGDGWSDFCNSFCKPDLKIEEKSHKEYSQNSNDKIFFSNFLRTLKVFWYEFLWIYKK